MKKPLLIITLFISCFSINKAQAQEQLFLGEVVLFAGNFAPRGWAFCDGQLLSIAQNTALFSILGTTYGGDGRTTFALPDFRGRAPVHAGSGPGLSNRRLGSKGGGESVILTAPQLPSHGHVTVLKASSTGGDGNIPDTTLSLAAGQEIYTATSPGVQLNPASVVSGNTGGSQLHENMQPYLTMNYIIALTGIYPSRN